MKRFLTVHLLLFLMFSATVISFGQTSEIRVKFNTFRNSEVYLGFHFGANKYIRDTFQVNTHSLELRGSLGLTPNWNVDIGSIGYDFARKQTTYPYLGLRRDLHCWELGFNWAPTRNTYSFYLRVKPGTLDFLKVPYQRNNADGSRAF